MAEQNEKKQQNQKPEPDLNQILKARREKLKNLQESGHDPFLITTYDADHHSADILEHADELMEQNVSVAGRMMSKRVMGKASFCHIQDKLGRIQCYVSRNDLGDEEYAAFKKLDVGDIVGIRGFVFRTKTGEVSIHVLALTLLSKSLQPLPEKSGGRILFGHPPVRNTGVCLRLEPGDEVQPAVVVL